MRMSTESDEFERQVALQSMIAAILFVGEGILFTLEGVDDSPSLAQCVTRAKEVVSLTENSVGDIT